MAALTDTLNTVDHTPRVIGGTADNSGGLLGGLAKGAADMFDMFGRSTKKVDNDDPVLDQAAMAMFEDRTGLDLARPDKDHIVFAKRLESAKDAGAISRATYDIRLKGHVANLIRDNPNKAEEIMALAAREGVTNHLYREAMEADDFMKNEHAQYLKVRNGLLEDAAKSGRYNPDRHSVEDGIAMGIDYRQNVTNHEMTKAKFEAMKAEFDINTQKNKPILDELQGEMINSLLGTYTGAAYAGLEQLLDLTESAGTDEERQEALETLYPQIDLALQRLTLNGRMFMDAHRITYPDANGDMRSLSYDDKARASFELRVKDMRDMFNTVRALPADQQKRALERIVNNAKLTANKYMPTLSAMKEAYGGMGTVMDWIANADVYGLNAAAVDSLVAEHAAGIDQWVEHSAQNIKRMTDSSMFPSSNPDAKISEAAIRQNSTTMALSRGQIMAGKYGVGNVDQQSIFKNYSKAAEDVVMGYRRNYTPNSITIDKAKVGLDMIFNAQMIQGLDKYELDSGDSELASLLRLNTAVAASTFVEGLETKYQGMIEYDQATGKYVPVSTVNQGWVQVAGMSDVNPMPPFDLPNDNLKYEVAATANRYLDFLDRTQKSEKIIREDVLKATGLSLRDIVADQGSLEKGIKWAGEEAKRKEDESADAEFTRAIERFDMDTNPFDGAEHQPIMQGLDTDDVIGTVVEQFEGGWDGVAENDAGAGLTIGGINAKANNLDPQHLRDMSKEDKREIYQKNYLDPVLKAGVPRQAQLAVYDAAVNMGVGPALEMWKQSNGSLETFAKLRLARYNRIIEGDKSKEQYRKVWTERTLQTTGYDVEDTL